MISMAFDGIAVRALARELNTVLAGGRVEKIYQPEKDELIFAVRTGNGKVRVYASSNNSHAGIFITADDYDNPVNPPGFCMLLRKHLQGSRIVSVIQKDLERIIEVEFDTRDELGYSVSRKLIVEIMGKYSNIVLVDMKDAKIIDSIKRISFDMDRVRQILPGQTYEYPPEQKKIPYTDVTLKDIEACCLASETGGRPLADTLLSDIMGISPLIARTLAGADGSEAGEVFARLRAADDAVMSGHLDCAVYTDHDGVPKDFHVVTIPEYEEEYTKIPFVTVSGAAEYYYRNRSTSSRVKQKASAMTAAVGKALKKQRLKKQRLSEDLLRAENSDKYRLYGELLTANLHLVKTGDKKAVVTNYYDGSEITIPLDERFAPAKNAQIYFKKYAKAKTAVKEKKVQLDETDGNIVYLESVESFIETAQTTEEIDRIREELEESGYVRRHKQRGPKKKEKPQPFHYMTSDGCDVLAGRNNRENDYLTFRTAGRNDIWFHTKDIPGSHVILFTRGKAPSDTAIFETAAIAAYHSKGRSSENVPVDYTEVRYVKKPNGAKPGMVIFTDNRTVYVTPKRPDPLIQDK
jgi:predicted ribosome quality control (RQC) complex YloA/Tae2 family protein